MAAVIYDGEDTMGLPDGSADLPHETSLSDYVVGKVQEWSDNIEANYLNRWEEYNRLWRGEWAQEDKTREDERSRIISPALQQAVEDAVADVEEATFSTGKSFDIKDDSEDQDNQDIAFMRKKLHEDFSKQAIRKEVSDVLLNAAVFGTGIAEVVLDEVKEMAPATQPIMDGQLTAVGVNVVNRTVVKMRSVQPRNFRIDPNARNIEEAHGVAIDEFVPWHLVKHYQDIGIYRDVPVGDAPQDYNIEADPELDTLAHNDKVRLTKYFGKVPRHLLEQEQGKINPDEEIIDLVEPTEEELNQTGDYWVEAIVIIANEGEAVLKVEENPYMMKDRPVVAFQWDMVPGIFWGRGICEKGYNVQKAIDAELRARIDALGLTIHPMLAMDATRVPRGHRPKVSPGKVVLTNGNPNEVLQQFNFGSVDQVTFAQAEALQTMMRQATGTLDGATLSNLGSNNKTGATSMAIGAMQKRQKRTLVNFEQCFWVPFIEKAAWRYMQFDADNYPVQDFKFIANGNLGTMQSEYEVSQLVQLLQTADANSPIYPAIVQAIVEHMNIENREELVQTLMQASQPNPEEQQKAEEAHQKQMALQDAQIQAVQGQGQESMARAKKYMVEAQLLPRELEIKKIDAVADIRQGVESEEYQRRLKITETRLKEKEINIREQEVRDKRLAQQENNEAKQQLKNMLNRDN